MKGFYSAAAIAAVMVSASATAQTVTPTDRQGWNQANIRGTGSVAITDTYKPTGQGGSLQFSSSGSGDKADYTKTWNDPTRTLGSLTSLSFSVYRDSSSTASAWFAPAFRLNYFDQATNKSGYLIYEAVLNGYPTAGPAVPTNQFVTLDMTNANFWMRAFGTPSANYGDATGYKLSQYASGFDADRDPAFNGAHILSANTIIYGIEVGVGSGWSGTFNGAVDNVRVAFGSDVVSANFEPTVAAAVPEPMSWALMIVGFGAVGASLRSARRRKVVFAA